MMGFNLMTDIPMIYNRKEMYAWLQPLYIIDDYTVDRETYRVFRTKVYNVLRGCFHIKVCRNAPIRFKFSRKDTKEYKLPFRMFVINTILWYPFVELHGLDVLDEEFILSDPEIIPDIVGWINEKLITVLNEYHIKSSDKNFALSEVLYYLRHISIDYSIILGLDFSIPMFIDLYKNYPRIKELMEATFEDTMQPNEVEQDLAAKQSEFIEIVSGIDQNPLGMVLRAKTGIKPKQLAEFTISEGMKPDLTGKTIPVVIQNSTLIRGTDKPSYVYTDGTASRKSLVMNKKVMGNAGAFGKTVNMSARTLSMSKVISDCGSQHLVAYNVANKAVLKKLHGKYYRLTNHPNDELTLLKSSDKHLIGKTIYVRSAATCCCGDTVCAKCIGMAAVTNADLSDGISAFESEEITKVVNQNILSAKHLLTTNSEEIRFNSEFYKFFTLVGGEINPIVNDNQDIDNIEEYAIYVDPADMTKIDDQDEDSLYNTVLENGRFYIRNIEDPEEPDIVIQTEGEKEIFIPKEISEMLHANGGIIRFAELDDDTKVFEVVIMNNELTKPLYDLMHLLDRQNREDIDETIDSISNRFLELIIEAKIKASVIACELIINRLIRSQEDIFRRPDFSKPVLEPYTIITVRQSLEKSRSPINGMSFQNIRRQLLSDELFDERTGTSYLDPLFNPIVDASNLKKYEEYAKAAKMKQDHRYDDYADISNLYTNKK